VGFPSAGALPGHCGLQFHRFGYIASLDSAGLTDKADFFGRVICFTKAWLGRAYCGGMPIGPPETKVEPEDPMLSSTRHLRDFPEPRLAGGAHGVTARLSNAAAGGDRLLAQALEALHGWQVRQAEREIHRYRRLVRSSSN
jgi:hypothetical protein